ncbi:MAG: methyltransferase domain-containing protein [Bacteroidales bacterium]|nr:methyltransferase domain-containing protein [Bacteroidales bacterium]
MSEQSDSRSQILEGIEYRFSSDWIHQLEGEEHWRSYWHQLRLVLPELKEGDTILEIGPGSGFVTNYLRSKGYQVTTLDIDDEKSPDIVANLVEYPFPDAFDHVLAFEVFEHIPFEKFTGILPQLKKSARKNLFMSVPRNYRIWFHADLVIPYFKEVSFSIKTKRRKIITGNHFWELDYKQYNVKNLVKILGRAGFEKATIKMAKTMVFFQLRSQA